LSQRRCTCCLFLDQRALIIETYLCGNGWVFRRYERSHILVRTTSDRDKDGYSCGHNY